MRIVITSAPKTGNHWLKCLLRTIYGLGSIDGSDKQGTRPEEFRAWAVAGGFPDGTILHQHARFSHGLADAIAAAPAHSATIIRDPYDVFVSLYFWVQTLASHELGPRRPRPRDVLVGKPLDHPDALTYLAQEFGTNLGRAIGWLESGRAVVVRYEGLHRDPVAELEQATRQIEPVRTSRLEAAIEECRADTMRQSGGTMPWHVRSAKVGDSRQRLGEAHLAVFRHRHADAIRALGYEVR